MASKMNEEISKLKGEMKDEIITDELEKLRQSLSAVELQKIFQNGKAKCDIEDKIICL